MTEFQKNKIEENKKGSEINHYPFLLTIYY